MTQLLISVTNVDEARIAIENGADIIDLKDPADGALGALDIQTVEQVVNFVGNIKLVSATIGNIEFKTIENLNVALVRVKALIDAKVDVIKIGFFDDSLESYKNTDLNQKSVLMRLVHTLEAMCLSKTVKFVAVLFAENNYHIDFIDFLLSSSFDGIMIDTMRKNGKTYQAYDIDNQFKRMADHVIAADAWFGVAGSLQTQDIALAKQLNPTYIGFRGAACEGHKRKNALSAMKVHELCKTM
jgi:(5-formylfuran-3-yl)methyl phosphate synthase